MLNCYFSCRTVLWFIIVIGFISSFLHVNWKPGKIFGYSTNSVHHNPQPSLQPKLPSREIPIGYCPAMKQLNLPLTQQQMRMMMRITRKRTTHKMMTTISATVSPESSAVLKPVDAPKYKI